ncbi:MAG TPA: sulfur carrier protein ThiS [Polyangia bacterium]|nr:sulfur carrier protein ThiS [Polyangia bacterium]
MQVRVNGDALEVPEGCTVASLLERIEVEPTRVAVERNQDVVPRRDWSRCALADGDQVEIVTFVGGG